MYLTEEEKIIVIACLSKQYLHESTPMSEKSNLFSIMEKIMVATSLDFDELILPDDL